MSACEYCQRAGAYYDGELSGEEMRRFEEHLAGCAACAKELAELSALSRQVSGAGTAGGAQSALERAHKEASRVFEREIVRMTEMLTAAAAVLFMVLCGWAYSSGNAGEQSSVIATWELAAVTPLSDVSSGDAQMVAQWIVLDLSAENGNE